MIVEELHIRPTARDISLCYFCHCKEHLLIYTSPKWKPYVCGSACYKQQLQLPLCFLSTVCKGCAACLMYIANLIEACSTSLANYAEKDGSGTNNGQSRRRDISATGRTESAGSNNTNTNVRGRTGDSSPGVAVLIGIVLFGESVQMDFLYVI